MSRELASEAVLLSKNPATGDLLGQVKIAAPEEITNTVAGMKSALSSWRNAGFQERLLLIRSFHELLAAEKETVSQQITNESGKPFTEALVSEVFAVLETCEWLQNKADHILQRKPVELNPVFFGNKVSFNEFEPLGLVAVISPWNYPFSIPATSMLLALAAGNAVILKPSPKTPLTAKMLVDLFRRSGFPEEVVGLVQGDREQAEALILSGVNRVVFTGSVAGGKAIMEIASKKLVPVTLELGGKHPAIVLPDACPEKVAAALVWSAFTNCGQACASLDRLYLVKENNPRLLPLLVELTKKLRLGNGIDADVDVGPMIDEAQLKRVESMVEDAVSKGARVLAGGKRRKDIGELFYEPCLITDITPSMRLFEEEIFGPVLPVFVVGSVEEAVSRANQFDLGLAASIWTANETAGAKLARELEAGVVWINDGLYSHVCPDAPWGGIKYSGFGKAHSESELLDMVYCKNIGVSPQGKRDWHYPYSRDSRSYVAGGVDLLHKKGLIAKLKAVIQVLSAKVRM